MRKNFSVLVLSNRIVGKHTRMRCSTIGQSACVHADERIDIRDRKLLHLIIQLLDELGPVLEADFENFSVVYLRNSDKIEMGLYEEVLVW